MMDRRTKCITSSTGSLGQMFEKAGKHAFADMWMGGVRSAAYGGEMSPVGDMISGALSSVGNGYIDGGLDNTLLKIVSSAVLGGTISEIGGGKFANGAVTGAYSMLFNEVMHRAFTDRQLKKIYDAYPKPYEYGGISRENLYDEIGGDVLDIYLEYKDKEGYVESMENTCAIRLSRALNYSGFSIPGGIPDTAMGADGKYYFFNAEKMMNYLSQTKVWASPHFAKISDIKNAVVFQTGFSNASGHLDVIYRRQAANHVYDKKNITTYYWH